MNHSSLPEFDGIEIISFKPTSSKGFYKKFNGNTDTFDRRTWAVQVRNTGNYRREVNILFTFVTDKGVTKYKTWVYFPVIEPNETVQETLSPYDFNSEKVEGNVYLKRFQLDRNQYYRESEDIDYLVGRAGPINTGFGFGTIGCLIVIVILFFLGMMAYSYIKSYLFPYS